MSVRSRMINFLIRKNHLFRGKLKKEVFDENSSITGFRERCEKGAQKYAKVPKEIIIKQETIEGMNCEWLSIGDSPADKMILYVHGGGYVSGSCNDHRAFVSKFVTSTGIKNLIYEYRLAPEFPFPAALEDSLKIYRWLLSRGYSPNNIVFVGESAGGGLLLALLLALKDEKIPMPAAAVSISPWTDLTCSSESYSTKNKVSPAPLNSWTVFSKHYTGNDNPLHPYISPLYGDLTGLPPIFINSGENDELFEDGEKFYIKAKNAGAEITFRAGKKMMHCYPLLAPMFPEATEAFNEIILFIKKYL